MSNEQQLSESAETFADSADQSTEDTKNNQNLSSMYKVGRIILSVLRILFGAVFVAAGTSKILAGDLGSAQMIFFLEAKQQVTFPFYGYFIQEFVLESPFLFAAMVAFGETVLGLSLLLGAKIRLSTAFGIVMVANFMLAKGGYPWQLGGDQFILVMLCLFFYFSAGLHWGLDRYWLNNLGAKNKSIF